MKPFLLISSLKKATIYIQFVFLIFIGLVACGREPSQSQSVLSRKYRGYNLVILVLDTLRADHLGCYGYIRNTSPRIDELSRKSILCENFFSSIPITLPSHASILTGLYPQNSGLIYNYGQLPDKVPILSSILKKEGYRTAAIVSTAVLKRDKKLDRGFDEYHHNFDISSISEKDPVWKAKGIAEDANRFARTWLEKVRDERFFLFINYYDTHAPFLIQPGYWNMFNPDSGKFLKYLKEVYPSIPEPQQKRRRITRYDRSIAYVDDQIDQLIKFMKKIGVLDHSIIIITADHGNGLYQHHDYWTHGRYLFDEQIKIPLLLILPGWKSGRISNIIETVDLMPTVLDLLGITFPEQIDGKSVVPILETGNLTNTNRAFAMNALQSPEDKSPRQYSVRNLDYKLIFQEDGIKELYNLKTDPFEKENLINGSDKNLFPLVKQMEKDGADWLKKLNPRPLAEDQPDSRTMKELKALGYMQ